MTAIQSLPNLSGLHKKRLLLSLLFALLYSVGLASLPVDVFSDRLNYLNYATDSWVILLLRIDEGWLSLLSNEPLWLLFNAALSIFLAPENVVRAVIFCSSALVAWNVSRYFHDAPWKAVLILLFPLVIRYHITALRNGLALALFLVGWLSPQLGRRLFFFVLAALVHVSYFIVLILFAVSRVTEQVRFASDLRMMTFALFSLLFALFARTVAALVGARHAFEYSFAPVEFSGLGILFWSSILLLMWLQGKEFLRRHSFEAGCVVFYMVAIWLADFAARAFESTSLLILLACLHMTSWRLGALVALMLSYMAAYMFVNIDNPWLGFG